MSIKDSAVDQVRSKLLHNKPVLLIRPSALIGEGSNHTGVYVRDYSASLKRRRLVNLNVKTGVPGTKSVYILASTFLFSHFLFLLLFQGVQMAVQVN